MDTVETLIKSWSELRDEANRLREQLTAAEQVERDAHARVEAALAAAGWGYGTNGDDKQDPSMWKVGDQFEVIGNVSSHGFDVGETVKVVRLDTDGIHRYSNNRREWWVNPQDLRKL